MLLRSGPGPGPGARTWQLCSCSRRLRLDAGLRIKALHVPEGPSVEQNHLLLLRGRCPEARAGSRHPPRSARRDLHRRLAMREIAGRSSLVVFLLSLISSVIMSRHLFQRHLQELGLSLFSTAEPGEMLGEGLSAACREGGGGWKFELHVVAPKNHFSGPRLPPSFLPRAIQSLMWV